MFCNVRGSILNIYSPFAEADLDCTKTVQQYANDRMLMQMIALAVTELLGVSPPFISFFSILALLSSKLVKDGVGDEDGGRGGGWGSQVQPYGGCTVVNGVL